MGKVCHRKRLKRSSNTISTSVIFQSFRTINDCKTAKCIPWLDWDVVKVAYVIHLLILSDYKQAKDQYLKEWVWHQLAVLIIIVIALLYFTTVLQE